LQDISNQRGLTFDKRRPSKEVMLDALSDDVAVLGIKAFVQILKVSDLEGLTTKLPVNSKAKVVLSKRLSEAMQKDGITRFLTSAKPSEELLKSLLERLGVVEPTATKKELIDQIQTEIHYLGLSTMFSNCTVKQLKKYTADLGLTVESSAQTVLLRCLLEMKDYKAEDKPKIARKPRAPKQDTDGDTEMPEYKFEARKPFKGDYWLSDDDEEDADFPSEEQAEPDEPMTDVASEKEDEDEDEEEDVKEAEDDGAYEEKGKKAKKEKEEEELADVDDEDEDDDSGAPRRKYNTRRKED